MEHVDPRDSKESKGLLESVGLRGLKDHAVTKVTVVSKVCQVNSTTSMSIRVTKTRILNHQYQKLLKKLLIQKLQRLQSSNQPALKHQRLNQHQTKQLSRQPCQQQGRQAILSLPLQPLASLLVQAC